MRFICKNVLLATKSVVKYFGVFEHELLCLISSCSIKFIICKEIIRSSYQWTNKLTRNSLLRIVILNVQTRCSSLLIDSQLITVYPSWQTVYCLFHIHDVKMSRTESSSEGGRRHYSPPSGGRYIPSLRVIRGVKPFADQKLKEMCKKLQIQPPLVWRRAIVRWESTYSNSKTRAGYTQSRKSGRLKRQRRHW